MVPGWHRGAGGAAGGTAVASVLGMEKRDLVKSRRRRNKKSLFGS